MDPQLPDPLDGSALTPAESPASGNGSRYRARAGQMLAAVSAQGIQAAASFVLQVYAARTLGAAEYGQFTVLLSLLIVLSALQAGLRDGGIVLADDDPDIGPTLATAQWVGAAIASAIGIVVAAILGFLDGQGLVLLGVMVFAWVLEEAIRRALMATMRFDKVAINDIVYAVVSVGAAVALISTDTMAAGLNAFLVAMALGATASILFGLALQVPTSVLKPARPDPEKLRRLGTFAVWRSWQGLVRPLSVFATRVGVGALAGDAALGRLEAGRLLVAPFAVIANGLGTFLLPFYLRQRGKPDREWRQAVIWPAFLLLVLGLVLGAVLVAISQPLTELLIGDFSAPTVAVAGWVLFTVLDGASTPFGVAAISLGYTRKVAAAKTVGAVLGMAVAIPLATEEVWYVPYALAGGNVIGTLLLVRVALSGQVVVAPAREQAVTA